MPVFDTTLQCSASPKQAYFLGLYSFFPFTTYGKDVQIFSCSPSGFTVVLVQTGTPLAGRSFLWRGSSSWSVRWYAVPPFGPRIAPILYSGVLAYVIGKMDGIGGKRGWQW